MSSGRRGGGHHPPSGHKRYGQGGYQGEQQQQQSYNQASISQSSNGPQANRFPTHEMKQQQQQQQQPQQQQPYHQQIPTVSVNPQNFYQNTQPGNGSTSSSVIYQMQTNAVQQQRPQGGFNAGAGVMRMGGPPGQGGQRMPMQMVATGSPRAPNVQGGPVTASGYAAPPEMSSYPNPAGGNGHLPHGMPPPPAGPSHQPPPPPPTAQQGGPTFAYIPGQPGQFFVYNSIAPQVNQGNPPRPPMTSFPQSGFMPPGLVQSGGQLIFPQYFQQLQAPNQYQQQQPAAPGQTHPAMSHLMNLNHHAAAQLQFLQQQGVPPVPPGAPVQTRPQSAQTPPASTQMPQMVPQMPAPSMLNPQTAQYFPSAMVPQPTIPPHMQQPQQPQPQQQQQQRTQKKRTHAIRIVDPVTNEEVNLEAAIQASGSSNAEATISTAESSTAPPTTSSTLPSQRVTGVESKISQLSLSPTEEVVAAAASSTPAANDLSEPGLPLQPIAGAKNVTGLVTPTTVAAASASATTPVIHSDKPVEESITTTAGGKPEAERVTPSSSEMKTPTSRSGSVDYEPISPTPLPETPRKAYLDDDVKNKNLKKKTNAVKRTEIPKESSGHPDAFRESSTPSSAEESTVTTPESAAPATEMLHPEVSTIKQEVGNHVEVDGLANHHEISGGTTPDGDITADLSKLPTRSESAPTSKSSSQIKLKYPYNENQWSPINQDGKKQYSRDFLLMLQNDSLSKERPPNLPNMDIVKDKLKAGGGGVGNFMQGDLFMPPFVKSMNQRISLTKKPSRDGRDSAGKRPPMSGPVKILDVKIEKVELHQTENAWKPEKLKDPSTNGADPQQSNDEVEVLLRKARGILNKLCPQKFDVLVEKFNRDLQIDTEEKLRRCIELVYEKAIDEPGFSVAYARMCEVMKQKQVMTTGPSGEPQVVNFRKLLVSRCQIEFQRDYMHSNDREKFEADLKEAGDDEAKKKILQSEWEEKEMRARRRSLGNIRFIGELYKLKMLTGRIMHECINQLIHSTEEEPLECLCRLLTTVGKDLEQETMAKLSTSRDAEFKNSGMKVFDEYFNKIVAIIAEKSISSRVRFMLQDLVDLRRSNWVPRRDVAGPKTIDQIHKEAEREKTQNQLLNDLVPMRGGNMGGRDSMQGSNRGGPGGAKKNSRDDEWKTPSRPINQFNERIDTSKISNFANSQRRMDSATITLGGQRNNWSSGSGSMILTKPNKEDPGLNTQNKYTLLAGHDSGPHSLSSGGGGYSSMTSGPSSMDFDNRRLASGPSRSVGMPARSSRGPSMEVDRQRVVDSFRQTKTNGPTSLSHDVGAGTSGSGSVGPPPLNRPASDKNGLAEEQAKLFRGDPSLSSEDIDKKIRAVLEEYVGNENDKEAVDATRTYFHHTLMATVVEKLILYAFDQKEIFIKQSGKLVNLLITSNLLLSKQFDEGLKSIFNAAEEMIFDYPKFWLYIGELIAPSLLANTLPMSFLADSGLSPSFSGNYLAGVLKVMVTLGGKDQVAALWQTSGLSLDNFMSPEEMKSFVDNNKFEFTLKTKASPPGSVKWIQEELEKLLARHPKQTDEVVAWIEKNVGNKKTENSFIQALTTAVTKNVITEVNGGSYVMRPEYEKESMNLLRKYIDTNPERELHALFALQLLMHQMESPPRLLNILFTSLYENDVITRAGFKSWVKCEEPSKQEGKGAAVMSTCAFRTYLDEDEEEDDDDDDEEDGEVETATLVTGAQWG